MGKHRFKKCKKCKQKKSLNEFTINNSARDGLSYNCKDCIRVLSQEGKARLRRYYFTKPENKRKARGKWLLRYWPDTTWEIALNNYDQLLASQNNACALCKHDQSEFKAKFCVDHDHSTNKIRGLLCNTCNRKLVSDHTLDTAMQLVEYLKQFEK